MVLHDRAARFFVLPIQVDMSDVDFTSAGAACAFSLLVLLSLSLFRSDTRDYALKQIEGDLNRDRAQR